MNHIDFYSDAWVNNEIIPIEHEVSSLIYQNKLTEKEINSFLNYKENSDFSDSEWSTKGILNFPGPFYTGQTDSCGTGIIEAPQNIIFDENFSEYVMIQPRNKIELMQLWNAGNTEVFGSYHCDGNKHWTPKLVKEWWQNKQEILDMLTNGDLIKLNCNQEKRYRHYIENQAETDLKKYCFFLENGYYPTNEKLPEIS
jgi:hypothetical protein